MKQFFILALSVLMFGSCAQNTTTMTENVKHEKVTFKNQYGFTLVSDLLGFEYPQHFVRFFKALTGKTPTQWRAA